MKVPENKEKSQADLSIFFDESGKGNQPNQLMGGLSLPTNIYRHESFTPLHELNSEYSYHWSAYDGDSKKKQGILKLFEFAGPLAGYANLIFIRYSQQKLNEMAHKYIVKLTREQKELLGDTNLVEETIYTKIPERIMYGLLRSYGDMEGVTASLYVERANEYERLQLVDKLKLQLNMHSLYRGESFVVQDCDYRSKGEEIGVELTDIILGIFRTVLENPDTKGRGKTARVMLILELHKRGTLQPFLNQLKLFEWGGSKELKELRIETHLQMFISKHYAEYEALNVNLDE